MRVAQGVLWAAIFIQLFLNTLIQATSSPTLEDFSRLWTRYIVIILPLVGYIYAYLRIYLHYSRMMERLKGVLKEPEIRAIR